MTEEEAKGRFLVMMMMRAGGLLIALVGLLLLRGGVLADEPMPIVGAALLLFGMIESALAPKLLKRIWDKNKQ